MKKKTHAKSHAKTRIKKEMISQFGLLLGIFLFFPCRSLPRRCHTKHEKNARTQSTKVIDRIYCMCAAIHWWRYGETKTFTWQKKYVPICMWTVSRFIYGVATIWKQKIRSCGCMHMEHIRCITQISDELVWDGIVPSRSPLAFLIYTENREPITQSQQQRKIRELAVQMYARRLLKLFFGGMMMRLVFLARWEQIHFFSIYQMNVKKFKWCNQIKW